MFKTQWFGLVVVVFLFLSAVPLGVVGQKSVVCVEDESSSVEPVLHYQYYADFEVYFSNRVTDFGIHFHVNRHFHANPIQLVINLSEVDELVVHVQLNCSVSMNYSAGFPYVFFSPVAVLGFMMENYTDYYWLSIKLKHNGFADWSSKISFNISCDLEDAVDGGLYPLMLRESVFTDPLLDIDEREDFHSLFFRFFYHLRNIDGGFFYDVLLPSLMDSGTNTINYCIGGYLCHY